MQWCGAHCLVDRDRFAFARDHANPDARTARRDLCREPRLSRAARADQRDATAATHRELAELRVDFADDVAASDKARTIRVRTRPPRLGQRIQRAFIGGETSESARDIVDVADA